MPSESKNWAELVCPFTPQLTAGVKWVKCITNKCAMWDDKKKKCGLVK